MVQAESDDLASILARNEVFGGLPLEVLRSVADAGAEIRAPAGTVLMRPGDPPDAALVLLTGRVVVTDGIASEADRVLNELGPGTVLGELALLAGGARSATVKVSANATLFRIPRDAFEQLTRDHPTLLARATELVRRRLRRSQLVAYLDGFVGQLDPGVVRELEETVEWVRLKSGETLFREGDPADAAFGVVNGRLRIVSGGGTESGDADRPERVLNEVARGETVGEMALLSEDSRSATAYAIRDTDLVRFPRDLFDRLVRDHPQVMTQIARLVARRLKARSGSTWARPGASARTLAIVPARLDVDLDDFSVRLVEALTAQGSCLHLTAPTVDHLFGKSAMAQVSRDEPASLRLAQWLNEQEASHRFVIYQADREWSAWTERCARQADHVLVVANAPSSPEPGDIEHRLDGLWPEHRSPRRTLILIHPESAVEPRGTARWLDARRVDRHFHLRASSSADFARLARALSGTAIGLVLGGGGARGFAHVGVIRALEEIGIPIDMVGGASMGALIAGGFAMGWNAAAIQQGCRDHCISVFDPTLPLVALLAGRKIRQGLAASFGDREIEDLWIPYFAVSTNLTRAESIVHERGRLATAVRCSVSLPGIMPPVHHGGDLIVDGGLLDNLPIEVMGAHSEGGRTLAVDVSPEVDLASVQGFAPELSGWRLFWQRLNPWAQPPDVPGIHSVLVRSTLVASVRARNDNLADQRLSLYLQPAVDRWGILDFKSLDEIAQAGYCGCKEPLRTWWDRQQRTGPVG